MTNIAMDLYGLLRGKTSTPKAAEVNGGGSLMVSRLMPPLAQLGAEGRIWTVGEATAVAAVTALPTTTAGITLYNNEPGTGLCYVLLKAIATQVGASAALASWHLGYCLNALTATTRPTADIAAASIKTYGKSPSGAYGGNAILDLAATVVDDLWKPVGPSVNTAVVSLSGTAIEHDLQGAVVLFPGGAYSLKGIAADTGITLRLGLVWAEVPQSYLIAA